MTGWPGEMWRSSTCVLEKNKHRVALNVVMRLSTTCARIDVHHSRTIEWEDAEWQWVGGEPEQSGKGWAL